MASVTSELDASLENLREAVDRVRKEQARELARLQSSLPNQWPTDYFIETAGALAGEEYDRPPQGELPQRDDW